MYALNARNAHGMLPLALDQLRKYHLKEDSRNGPVLRFPEPVSLCYYAPNERVVFWPQRDANPFLHLAECVWMLAGRNDVGFLTRFAKIFKSFSDDGETFNGAYGHRWRHHFGIDQLLTIVEALKANPGCRRQVLSMWDGSHDLGLQSKDLPCNTHAYFQVEDGRLNMMVCNRSNDLVWGALGANVVHFSFLLEWMASAIGVQVGIYHQVSNNMHLYAERHLELMNELGDRDHVVDTSENHYVNGTVELFPIMSVDYQTWLQDLSMYLDEGVLLGLRDPFFRRVLHPMMMAHKAHKEGDDQAAFDALEQCKATDWKIAGVEWLERRR